MRRRTTSPTRLNLERLEPREVPSAVIEEHFDASFGLPAGWAQWSDTGAAPFAAVKNVYAPTRPRLLDFNPPADTASGRTWSAAAIPADAMAGVNVLLSSDAEAHLLLRGSKLDTAAPNYYALTVRRGLTVGLAKVIDGTPTALGAVTSRSDPGSIWARVTLDVQGQTLRAKVYRPDTRQYLAADGSWQSAETWAVTATDGDIVHGGLAGLGRAGGDKEHGRFDDLIVSPMRQPPPGFDAVEDFDAAAVGQTPTGWRNYSNHFANFPTSIFQVTDAAAYSIRHGYTVSTVAGSTVVRSWRDTMLPSDQQASALLYLNSAVPAQLIVRGSGLDTANPEFYALTVDRATAAVGGGVRLQRYQRGADGVTRVTELATPRSIQPYTSGAWVRMTLRAQGSELRAELYRPDTNQYLNRDGTWQSGQTDAFVVTDAGGLTGGGYAGLGKNGGGPGPLIFDDFAAEATGPSVRFEFDSYAVTESAGAAQVSVVLSEPLTVPVEVAFSADAVPGSAAEGADYLAPRAGGGTTLTFLPGQTRRTFTVPVRWDAAAEADEFVNLRLAATGGVAVSALPARLTIRDTPRDSATTVIVDSAWLADPANLARPGDADGPYKLGRAGMTYLLDADVTRPGAGFVVTAAGVTLNLNWHTVNYDTGDYDRNGTADLVALPNGDFEESAPGDPTRPALWDLTGAPAARRAAARAGMWGASMLRLENITAPQTLLSAPQTLLTDAAGNTRLLEYAATITPKADRGDFTVRVTVLDAVSGAALATAEAKASDVGRGFSPVAPFVPGGATRSMRLRIDVIPQGTTPGTVDLDFAALTRSRAFGVMATRGYGPVPADLRAVSGYNAAANVAVVNGAVRQGAARSYNSPPLFFASLPGVRVDGVTAFATGMDTNNLNADDAADVDVRNSTFDADINRLSKRMVGFGAVHVNYARGQLNVVNNDVLNSPMYGVYVANLDHTAAVVSEAFNAPVGPPPAGWRELGGHWSIAEPVRRLNSTTGRVLAFDPAGDAGRSARAWSAVEVDPATREMVVAADVYVNSAAPSRVIANASGLDTAAPSYYAASVARAADGRLTVSLVRVENGVETPVPVGGAYTAQPGVTAVASPDAFADGWVRVTLEVWGPTVRVRVQRLDNSTHLKATLSTSTGVVTTRWASGDSDSWSIQARPAGDRLPGSLAGVERRAGDGTAKANFDHFTASRFLAEPARIADNRIRPRALVADGYGLLLDGLTNFEVAGNVIQPVNGRGILIEGADPSNPTRRGTIRDNWVEARETYTLEYPTGGLEATALRLRNFDAQVRDLTFTRNVFAAETDPTRVRTAIGGRVTLANEIGQAVGSNLRFEDNVFRATANTTDPAYQGVALSLAGIGVGTGLEFHGNTLESNVRGLNLGDASEYTAATRDVLMTGTTHRRSNTPARSDYRTVVAGEGSNEVSAVRLIGSRDESGAPIQPTFVRERVKEVSVGWLVTVRATGPQAAGATVQFEDREGRVAFRGTTDAAGRVAVPLATTIYRQLGTNPSQAQTDARGPFRLTVTTAGGSSVVREGLLFDADTVLDVAL